METNIHTPIKFELEFSEYEMVQFLRENGYLIHTNENKELIATNPKSYEMNKVEQPAKTVFMGLFKRKLLSL